MSPASFIRLGHRAAQTAADSVPYFIRTHRAGTGTGNPGMPAAGLAEPDRPEPLGHLDHSSGDQAPAKK